jgi:Listeria/Bacterioides repeat
MLLIIVMLAGLVAHTSGKANAASGGIQLHEGATREIEFSLQAQSITVTLDGASQYATIQSNWSCDWIKPNVRNGNTYTLTISKNNGGERNTDIVFLDGSKTWRLKIKQTTYYHIFPASGGELWLNTLIESHQRKVGMVSGASWITIVQDGTPSIKISADRNGDSHSRTGVIEVVNTATYETKSYKFKQQAAPLLPTNYAAFKNLIVSAKEGVFEVKFNIDEKLIAKINNSNSFVEIISYSNGILKFRIRENTNPYPRSGSITVYPEGCPDNKYEFCFTQRESIEQTPTPTPTPPPKPKEDDSPTDPPENPNSTNPPENDDTTETTGDALSDAGSFFDDLTSWLRTDDDDDPVVESILVRDDTTEEFNLELHPTPRLSAKAKTITFRKNGGSYDLVFTGVNGSLYSVQSWHNSWLDVTINGHTVTFTVKPCTADRSCVVVVNDLSGQSFDVTIKQTIEPLNTPTPTPIPVTPTPAPIEVHFPSGGGAKDLETHIAKDNIAIRKEDSAWFKIGIIETRVRLVVPENKTSKVMTNDLVVIDKSTKQTINYRIIQDAYVAPTPTPTPTQITVTFYTEGAIVSEYRTTQTYGKPYVFPENPKRTGYTFTGWYTKKVGGNLIDGKSIVNAVVDFSLYAHWEKNTPTYIACKPVYSDDINLIKYHAVYEGAAYGDIPAPYPRDGFTFDGWYTEPYGGELIKSTTTFNPAQKEIYAHWKVEICFFDFYAYGEEVIVEAQEGCWYRIPDWVKYRIENYAGEILGWSTTPCFPGSDEAVIPYTVNFQLPKNMTEPFINLYSVRKSASTLVDDFSKISLTVKKSLLERCMRDFLKCTVLTPEGVKEYVVHLLLGEPYDSSQHYKDNMDRWGEVQDKENPINGQRAAEHIKDMQVCDSDIGHSGCGVLACYNALLLKEKTQALPDLIKYCEEKGYFLHLPADEAIRFAEMILSLARICFGNNIEIETAYRLFEAKRGEIKYDKYVKYGGFGLDPFRVGDVLAEYGVKTDKYSAAEAGDFIARILDAYGSNESRTFVVAYWSMSDDENTIESAHTVCFSINGNRLYQGSKLIVYNLSSKYTEPFTDINSSDNAYYKDFRSFLEKFYINDKTNPDKNNITMIVGYEIK